MNREQAINIISQMIKDEEGFLSDNTVEAHKMAIKALEQEPCEDAISRQIISDYVESHIQEINTGYGDLNKHTNEILRMIVDYIEKMESVTPKPKTDVLDKIRAEIVKKHLSIIEKNDFDNGRTYGYDEVLEIIDKYKAESEE